jgi:uncharacterized protein (DUF2062 family)
MPPEEPQAREERFARLRRLKQFLRFMPRRAVMHKYPVIGRFAEVARKRAYLWSFKSAHVRPAFYAGSILSLLPVMGVQLPLAFILCLLLRGNFMVMGGLQFITNPFTAAPIYYATHQLGKTIIEASGFGQSLETVDPVKVEPVEVTDASPRLEPAKVTPPAPAQEIHWGRRIGTAINALVIGGVISGALLGLLLDLLWRLGAEYYAKKHPRPPSASRSTEPGAPPK